MDFPKRKPNRLPHYDYSTPGAYFITICTENRKPILSEVVGDGALDAPLVHLTRYGHIARKYIDSGNKVPGVTVDKYVIMPNHIHMLLFVNECASNGMSRASSPANSMIPHFVSTFKRFVYHDVGKKIFQRSYHDHVIRGEADYRKIWEYIDNNPAKWHEDCFYTEQSSRGVEGAAPYNSPTEETL